MQILVIFHPVLSFFPHFLNSFLPLNKKTGAVVYTVTGSHHTMPLMTHRKEKIVYSNSKYKQGEFDACGTAFIISICFKAELVSSFVRCE